MNPNQTNTPACVSTDAGEPQQQQPQTAPAISVLPDPKPAPRRTRPAGFKRLRSDSIWHRLKPDQREVINRWLEEGLSYREISWRAHEELDLELSLAAVSRFYHQGLRMQVVNELADAQESAKAVQDSGANTADLRKSAMKVANMRFLQKTMANADTRDVWAMGKLVLEGEQREIQRERIALMRDKFEFKASQAAMKALPLAEEFNKEDMEREEARMATLRRKLFGKLADQVLT
ncbi:MAG TPA: helix-turn-helix domain-containing protein [Verrucomicrobiae bacterium]|nr:helix-turn-helix domain-containing protein [Verrucomicrobiae bacterium]